MSRVAGSMHGLPGRLTRRALKSGAALVPRPSRAARSWLSGGRSRSARVLVLGYHRVVDDIGRAERQTTDGMVVSAGTFRRHLELLQSRSDVVSLAEAGAILRGEAEAPVRPAVAVTFDDGYRDVHDRAWPILREMGMPAAVFVSTGGIGTARWFDHDLLFWYVQQARRRGRNLLRPLTAAGLDTSEAAAIAAESDLARQCDRLVFQPISRRQAILVRLSDALGEPRPDQGDDFARLDWTMIGAMAGAGITIGAHGVHHAVLPLEDEQTRIDEIEGSRRALAGHLGQPVRCFAYPNGRYDPAAADVIRRLGFELAITSEPRTNLPGCDLAQLGRLLLCEESTRGITGRYSPAVARLRMGV